MSYEQSASAPSPFRSALLQQQNLILLAGAAGLSLALWSATPLLVALAGEALWLILAPLNPAFARGPAGRADAASTTTAADPEPQPARAQELQALAAEIARLAAERGADPDLVAHVRARLQALQQSFLRMAGVERKLSAFLGDGRGTHLEHEVVRLGQALAAEKDLSVKLSLRQALAIGQRQLKQHEQIENTRRALDVKLSTVEMSFGYLRSLLVGGASEAELIGTLEELESGTGFVAELETEATAAVAGAGGAR